MGYHDIPQDIIRDILLRIPAEILITYKVVCKPWYKLISDPKFVSAHLISRRGDFHHILVWHHVVQDPLISLHEEVVQAHKFVLNDLQKYLQDVVYIWDSCDGLLLLKSKAYEKIGYLCNPITRKCTTIPCLKLNYSKCVLTYDTNAQKYKVISYDETMWDRWYVFTPQRYRSSNEGAARWRKLNPTYRYSRCLTKPTVVNKELHWLAKSFNAKEVIVASLDVSNEKFRETKAPLVIPSDMKQDAHLIIEVMGSLCITAYLRDCNQLQLWTLQDRNKGLWTKEYTIMCKFEIINKLGPFFVSPPCRISSDQTRIIAYHNNQVFVYDLKNKRWQRIDFPVQGTMNIIPANFIHIHSLVKWE